MDRYEETKKQQKLEMLNQCFFYNYGSEIFRDIPVSRESISGLEDAICTAVEIAEGVGYGGILSLYERRFPALWTSIKNRENQFIIVTYATDARFEAGVIYKNGTSWKSFNGTVDEVKEHIADFITGDETFEDDPIYEMRPYTKFLSTLEATTGLNAYTEQSFMETMGTVDEYTDSLNPEPEERDALREFVLFLYQRMYPFFIRDVKHLTSGYIFTLKAYDDCVCTISFNPGNPGESGVRCTVMSGEGAIMNTSIIDNRRELECFINNQTQISKR